jgi:hypothetical protein
MNPGLESAPGDQIDLTPDEGFQFLSERFKLGQ